MAPGVTDILAGSVYLSLIAAIYLLLVSFGKIKDKEYYKPASATPVAEEKAVVPETPAAPESEQ